jgi:hypothetical protein
MISNYDPSSPICKYNPYYSIITINLFDLIRKNIMGILIKEHLKYQEINLDRNVRLFFNKKDYITKKENKEDNLLNYQYSTLRNSVFAFHNIPFSFIIAALKYNNILISKGSEVKRHLLSPTHLLLAQFITVSEGMSNRGIYDAFHSFDYIFTSPFMDHTLMDTSLDFKNNTLLFILLEKYCKIKLNMTESTI